MCKKLKFQNRWIIVEPNGMSGGLVVLWSEKVVIDTVITSPFCIEMECASEKVVGKFWVVFVYASTDLQLRQHNEIL